MAQPAAPENGAEPQPASRIILEFVGPGMADMQLRLEGVSAGQLMAAAWYLDQCARELRQSAPAGQSRLVIPRDHLPPVPKGH